MDIKKTDSTSINIAPAFGCTASFAVQPHVIKYGDNHSQISLKSINSLSMSLNLKFNELTDYESSDLISFLQSQFYYELQNYSNDGSFNNKRLTPFDYQPFFPYKKNKFNCISFTHAKPYCNINNVSATLTSIAPSILHSVESGPDHNPNIDAVINASLGNTSSVNGQDVFLSSGSTIYQSGNYSNATLSSSFNVSNGSSATLEATNNFTFNDADISCHNTAARHSIYINNPNDCSYYPYAPIHEDGNLESRMFDFRPSESMLLQHSPKYMQSNADSIYKKLNKYGFNPNLTNLRLNFNGRSDLEAKRILLFLESHLGYKKFGFHLSREYVGSMSDLSHTTPHRKSMSFFYCPEWTHTFVYKNNHSISASFIECMNY